MVKHNVESNNIFNITQPERYRCSLFHYHTRLSRLYLRVYKGMSDIPAFYLMFSDVGYMQCPAAWEGADFHIASHDDCIQLMLDTGIIGQAILRFPDAYASITDYARLYQLQPKNGQQIQIIASSANMLQQLPDGVS